MRRRPPRPGALSCCLAAAALVLCVDAAVEFLGTSDGPAKSHGASPDLWPWPWHAACAVGCALKRDVQEHRKRRGERAEEEGARAQMAPQLRPISAIRTLGCPSSAQPLTAHPMQTSSSPQSARLSHRAAPCRASQVCNAGRLTQTGGIATCTCRRARAASRVRPACSLALSHMPTGRQHPTSPPAHH